MPQTIAEIAAGALLCCGVGGLHAEGEQTDSSSKERRVMGSSINPTLLLAKMPRRRRIRILSKLAVPSFVD
jgi:hypothetical protein